jgi:uncharacterized membrane protein
MNRNRSLVAALAVLSAGQMIYYYPQMPERMASHFDVFGAPDGWMSKQAFFAFEIGLVAFFSVLFFGLNYLLSHSPDNLINLPNKKYWLAPERRAETMKIIRDEMEIFYIPIFLLLIVTNQLIFQANLTGANLSPLSWLFVAAFIIYTIFWSIGFNRKFKVYEN